MTALIPEDRAISGYRVYRNGSPVTPVTGTSYRDIGLTNGTSYSYYVTTVYASPAGASAASNTVSATPNFILEVGLRDGTRYTHHNMASGNNIT